MSGPRRDIVVVDLTRALAGPHGGMMLGDLGARVIKVETPGGGDDTRGWGPPFVGAGRTQSGGRPTSCRCNRNKESVTLDLKSDDGKSRADPAGRGPTCWWRTSAPACWTGSASRSSGCTSSTPAGRALDLRLRPRRPRGRPGRLRPDRPGRGGLMSLTGTGRTTRSGSACRSRTCWPACTAPTVSSPRSTSGTAPDGARSCAPRCWRRSSGCTRSRAPAARWPARSARPAATTTRRSARTACSTAPTGACRSRAAARACGAGCAPSSGSTRGSGFASNARAGPQPDEVVAAVDARSPTPARRPAGPAGRGRGPAGGSARWTRSTTGTRPAARACWSTWSTHAGRLDLPGPPLRFDGEDALDHVRRRLLGRDARCGRGWTRLDPRLTVPLVAQAWSATRR